MTTKNTTIYIPLKSESLIDFLASGFYGISNNVSSLELEIYNPYKIACTDNIDLISSDCCLSINTNEGFNFSDNDVLLTGPLPLSKIKSIVFFDQGAKDNFLASFAMFDGISLDYYNFEIIEKKTDSSKDSVVIETIESIDDSYMFLQNLLPLFVGIKDSLSCFKKINTAPINETFSKEGNSVASIIHRAASLYLNTSANEINAQTKYFLDLFLVALMEIKNRSNKVAPGNLISAMEEKNTDEKHSEKIAVILKKLKDIILGMSKFPDMSDSDANLTLQRAICLAITTAKYSAFDKLRPKLNIGNAVESIAKLLFLTSQKAGSIPNDIWKTSKDIYFNFLNAINSLVATQTLKIDSEEGPVQDNFETEIKLNFNGFKVAQLYTPPNSELQSVIFDLKTLGYSPKSYDSERAFIDVITDGNKNLKIFINVIADPENSKTIHNLKISCVIDNSSSLLNKKKERDTLISIIYQNMISFGLASSGNIEIARFQLTSTMDRDELKQHIGLLSSAYDQISLNLIR